MERRAGVFIAIEGIDAAGKKTQTAGLKSWLETDGFTVRTFSFPVYETTIGQEIKKFLAGDARYPPQVRAMLYAANRWETKEELERAIATSDVVIVNRYIGSNLAYGTSSGLGLDWLRALEDGLPQPDLVMVLDATPGKAALRRQHNRDSYERDAALQANAREAYLNLATALGWKVITADGGVAETTRDVQEAVRGVLEGIPKTDPRRRDSHRT